MSDLTITLTRNFDTSSLYQDHNSGAPMDVGFWRAKPPQGYYLLGDYAQGNYGSPTGTMVVVKDSVPNDAKPATLPPTGVKNVYQDKGSGATNNCSIWEMLPPDGYVALGFIVNNSYTQPPFSDFRCVRIDLTTKGDLDAGHTIWNDRGSGAPMDVTVYAINPKDNSDEIAVGTFYAQGNYGPPQGTVYCLNPAKVTTTAP